MNPAIGEGKSEFVLGQELAFATAALSRLLSGHARRQVSVDLWRELGATIGSAESC